MKFAQRFGIAAALAATPGCLKVPDDESADPGTGSVPSTAAEILQRHVKALGGEENLRAITQRTVEARVTFLPQQGCIEGSPDCVSEEQTGQFMLHSTADGRMFRRMVVGKLVSERGYDGTMGWELQGEPRVLVLDDDLTALSSREDALLHWYLDYEGRGIAPAIQSPRTTDDRGERRDLDGLSWTTKNGQLAPRHYWFDRMTGLLREEVEEEGGGQLRRTVIYDDYREVDGVQIPHRILQITQLGETRQEVEINVQRVHHADIRQEMFNVPQLPAPEPRVDELLAALDEARKIHESTPKDPMAAYAHAAASWASGHFDEATKAAKAVLKLAPNDPAALFILGRAQLLAGNFKGGEKTLKKAQKAGAHPARVAHHLANAKLHRHDFKGAAKLFEAAGEMALAERYAAFDGKPLQPKWGGNGCTATVDLVPDMPVPVVEAQIDGETLKLLVDSSAADIILDPERAHKLVIGTDAASELGGQGGPQVGHGQADKLVLGDFSVERVPVDVFPAPILAEMAVDTSIDGVLGFRALQETQLTIDKAAGKLTLVRNAGKCKKALAERRKGIEVPFWLYETHIMYVPAAMNDARGLYLVNSGMRGAALTANEDAYARAGVGAPILRRGDPGAFVDVDRVSLHDEFVVGPARAAWGYIAANATRDEFRFDGMLGLDILGSRPWTIDYAKRRFYFGEPAPAPAAKPKDDKPAAPAKKK